MDRPPCHWSVGWKACGHQEATNHNYKGLFAIVLMVIVDAQHSFKWVDIGTQGSCSDSQTFNDSELKDKIEDGTIGFPEAFPIQPDRDLEDEEISCDFEDADEGDGQDLHPITVPRGR